ncbi:hypothetical protein BDR06DRAFT_952805 [Suillus hirtellus]|nr:hypothetical protein BDR06DRAFT_952805 [Suillus hirtellus]
MYLNVDKELPLLPRYLSTPTGATSTPLASSSTGSRVDMEPPYPTLVLEHFPSSAELALISSWHDATSARQVRFQRKSTPDDCLRSFPLPISEAEKATLRTSCENDNTTPQKQRGLFTGERPVDAQKFEEKRPKTSMPFHSQKFAPYEATAFTTPTRPAYAPVNQLAFTSAPTHSIDAPGDELDGASQAPGIDMNDGGIYLTFDPDFRSSRGEAVLTFLSPIPDETYSPPVSQHRSLSEVQFGQRSPMPRVTSTRARMQ